MVLKYLVLIILWICWCAFHSLLISNYTVSLMKEKMGDGFRYYRLAYNGIAIVTLFPIVAYGYNLKGAPLLRWEGALVIVQVLCIISALFLFGAGARKYNLGQFSGIAQIKSGVSNATLSENGGLDVSGIHQITRHPWYFGGLLILWTYQPGIDLQSLLTNIVLSLYLVIGAKLEERKLQQQFGEEYSSYKKRVSMFLPVKWFLQNNRRS